MLFLHQIINGIWFFDSASAANYLPLVTSYLKGESNPTPVTNPTALLEGGVSFAVRFAGAYALANNFSNPRPEDAPADSLAILSINGAITKHDQSCGPLGMKSQSDLLERCFANPNINAVALRIDSGGGESMAMNLLADTLARRNKPVACFIDDLAGSAAYGIAACCDYITANSSLAQIGSIGAYITLADYREKLKNEGINLIQIYAPQSKDKNRDFLDALNGDTSSLERKAEVYCENFLQLIESNRAAKLKFDRSVWGTGKMFFADDALVLGLIDNIDNFENFLNYFNT